MNSSELKNPKMATFQFSNLQFFVIFFLLSPFVRLSKNDVKYNQPTVQTNLWLLQLVV